MYWTAQVYTEDLYKSLAGLKVYGGQGLKVGIRHATSVILNNDRTQNTSQQRERPLQEKV